MSKRDPHSSLQGFEDYPALWFGAVQRIDDNRSRRSAA